LINIRKARTSQSTQRSFPPQIDRQETMPTKRRRPKLTLAVLKRALEQQILEQEIKQSAFALKTQHLEAKIEELQEWKDSAKQYVDKSVEDRKSFQKNVAIREANVSHRERQLDRGFKELESLSALQQKNAEITQENRRLKVRYDEMKAMKDEILRQQKQRNSENDLTRNELRVVERLFVEHLEHMMIVDVTMHKQIGEIDRKNSSRNVTDISRDRLREELKSACSECPPGTPGSGIDKVAHSLLDKLSATYKKASKNSEKLGRRVAKLEAELKNTVEKLVDSVKEKSNVEKKLKAEELNMRAMSKRVDRLSHGEVGELRAMLTHSHKHYAELNGILREFLKFCQEEMRKSLGFVPRTVSQVAAICNTVPENPLADFEGYVPPVKTIIGGKDLSSV
jgi:hypothetical protein